MSGLAGIRWRYPGGVGGILEGWKQLQQKTRSSCDAVADTCVFNIVQIGMLSDLSQLTNILCLRFILKYNAMSTQSILNMTMAKAISF